MIKEEEEEGKTQSEQAKSDCSLTDKKKEEKHFSKIGSSDKEATLTLRKRQLFSKTSLYRRRFTRTLAGPHQ